MEKDSRVRVFSCPHKGIGATRNFGLLQAKGEWICFVDADDLLHPQCLEFAIRAAQKEQAEFVSWLYQNFTGVPLIKELSFADLLLVNTAFPLFYTFDKSQPCIHSFVVWGKLYRKTLLKDVTFDENSLVEDVPFVYEILNKRPHTVVIGQPLYYYRYRENSFSNIPTSLAKLKHYEQAILKVLAIFNPHYAIYKHYKCGVNENFETIYGPFTKIHTSQKIRINHYHSKSVEEYIKKTARGNADNDKKRIYLEEYVNFSEYTFDYAIQKYLPELKKRMKINK